MGSLVIKKRNNQRRVEDSRRARDTKVIKSKDDANEVLAKLTKEDVEALLELIPFKEALIKIAKGEFEIERIIEEDEDDDLDTEDLDGDDDGEVVGEDDEDGDDDIEIDENLENDGEDFDEDFDEDSDVVEDSNAINEAWKKRLNGSKDL